MEDGGSGEGGRWGGGGGKEGRDEGKWIIQASALLFWACWLYFKMKPMFTLRYLHQFSTFDIPVLYNIQSYSVLKIDKVTFHLCESRN